jgi:hypothetical protein
MPVVLCGMVHPTLRSQLQYALYHWRSLDGSRFTHVFHLPQEDGRTLNRIKLTRKPSSETLGIRRKFSMKKQKCGCCLIKMPFERKVF